MMEKKGRMPKAYQLLLIISLACILIGSIFASNIQTSFGKVAVSTVVFPTRDGQWVACDLYKPKTATFENKAPLVVVIAGFQRSRETQSGIALELARRGMVVLNIDPYSQGDSSSSEGREGGAIATYEGYGAYDIINYVYSSDVLSYVDKTKIGVTGHSAGGNAAYQAAVRFGRDAVNNNGVSKVAAAYISGYVLSFDSSIVNAKSNMGFDYALYDEGAFRNKSVLHEGETEPRPTADMTIAVESHDFVNSVLPNDSKIPLTEPIEMGKIYGDPSARTMRQVFNTPTIHAFQPYVAEANTNLIAFFEIALDFEYEIPANQHIWLLKEVFSTLALIGAFAFLVPFAILLLNIPFFKSLKCEVPQPVKKRNREGKIIFWVTFGINAAIAALTYIPLSKLTAVFFVKATASQKTWFFPQRMNNAVMLWAIVNGIAGMLVVLMAMFGVYFIKKYLYNKKLATANSAPIEAQEEQVDAQKEQDSSLTAHEDTQQTEEQKVATEAKQQAKKAKLALATEDNSVRAVPQAPQLPSIESWGLKIKLMDCFKTLLMAIFVAGTFFLILHTVNFFFHTDYRFLFVVAVRPLNTKVVLQMLMYVPLFFIFYLSNSIRVNGNMREEGQKEWLSLLICGIANTAGLTLILAIQYIAFGATGTVFWTEAPEMTEWLYVNILFGLIPVMFILPFFHRWFFRATGKCWLGPMVMSIIFISMMINNSVAYIPLP